MSLTHDLAEHDWLELLGVFDRLHGGASRRSVASMLDVLLLELYEGFGAAPEQDLWGSPRGPSGDHVLEHPSQRGCG